MALEVESREDALARLREHKIEFDEVDSPVCRMAVIEDPDGNKVIIHKVKTEAEETA